MHRTRNSQPGGDRRNNSMRLPTAAQSSSGPSAPAPGREPRRSSGLIPTAPEFIPASVRPAAASPQPPRPPPGLAQPATTIAQPAATTTPAPPPPSFVPDGGLDSIVERCAQVIYRATRHVDPGPHGTGPLAEPTSAVAIEATPEDALVSELQRLLWSDTHGSPPPAECNSLLLRRSPTIPAAVPIPLLSRYTPEQLRGRMDVQHRGRQPQVGVVDLAPVNQHRPGQYVLRYEPATGRLWACVPCSPFAESRDRDACDHCAYPPRRVLDPEALCRYHSYYFVTGEFLSHAEYIVLDTLDQEGSVLNTDDMLRFVERMRCQVQHLALRFELMDGSEQLGPGPLPQHGPIGGHLGSW
ncbi:uncharacterized protein E0L32_008969 [Thyridium curvatum]|uniref:FHA domain-containing protein n=1 Tax=Thyridium curvatum TaxID=1093900 RepID=A0A507AY80_9PEZI|nr:uncharacterized protein E0L32_008969 [Thyridium curvatum]TPX09778.1 hypothetical protein E0L32_008969 [Thyridium curvatum]